jgi:hypothetical protein
VSSHVGRKRTVAIGVVIRGDYNRVVKVSVAVDHNGVVE